MKKNGGLKKTGIALCLLLCLLNMSEQARFLAELPSEIYITDDLDALPLSAAPSPISSVLVQRDRL